MTLAIYKFSNPYEIESDKKYFTINNKFITIQQNKQNGIGYTFWDCSFLLSDYLEKKYKDNNNDWKTTTCLELGSGCGLVALTLTALNCNKVYATEIKGVLSNLEYNIELNKNVFENNGISKIETKELEWGVIQHYKQIEDKIDLLICCECLYEAAPWEKLLDTINYFTNINKNIEIIFAYKKRYKSQELFLNEFIKYYDCEYIPKKEFHIEFQKDIDFYEIIIARKKV